LKCHLYLRTVITAENWLLLGSILLLVSILTSKTSFRLGIPALILFLLVGMLAGSDGPGGIYFYDPQAAQFLGTIALTLILFSGGLDTKIESIRPVIWQGVSLATLGVLITATLVGGFVSWLLDFSFLNGMLVGAIVSSTDAAAVFSVLRTRRIGLKGNLRPLLELESGSNDPMAFFLTVALTQVVMQSGGSAWPFVLMFLKQMIIGGLAGYGMGRGMVWLINRIHLDVEGLYPVLVMALVFFTYSATDFIGGNGFLAVYLAGIWLGSSVFIHKKSLLRFYDGLAWLMQIVMFLTLGLLVFPKQILPIIDEGILVALFLMFVARPLAVFISLAKADGLNVRKKLFISWVGLRGAVPIVFATFPLLAGVPYSNMIFNLVFFVSVLSVLLQGYTLPLVAKWLRVSVPEQIARKSVLDLELNEGAKSKLFEFDVIRGAPAVGKSIVSLALPSKVLIVLIQRNEKYEVPRGTTVIHENDHLLIMADGSELGDQLHRLFEEKAT
jgi:potassium/hydrogen antiporter